MRPGLSRASGVDPSLLLFVFLCGSCAETLTRDSAASLVSPPTNVEIKSYNLNPEVFWDYQITSPTPTFTVQLRKYPNEVWNEVCTNISHKICNIFDHVKNSQVAYWARVKAIVGQNESSFVESEAFHMYEKGKIGPPTLKIQEKNDKLIIDIDHPLIIVEGEKKGTVCDYYYEEDDDDDDDYCSTLTYKVYLKIDGKKITEKETNPQSCNGTQCQLIERATSFNSEYCVSAKGFSQKTSFTIKSEEAEEQCITVSPNTKEDSSLPILITVVCFALVIFVLLIISYWVCKTKVFQKSNLILPKSLVSVIRNFPHNILEVNSESRYISVLETSHLPVTENEENTINHLTPSNINSEDNREKSEHFQEISSITEEMTVEENITEKTSDRNQSPTVKNYFHSNSNQVESGSLISNFCLPTDDSENRHVESCNFKSDPELPQSDPEIKADIQDSIILKVNTSFGYDKPHVLVDMLTDSNDKESLIGYRPSEPFMEIS
ncbi:interferon gamma receptor 1 isoform X2 [Antechinus flavipes]|uniref:interferon gamma receptor 1 isoform X2 n=1 Tax=Antechinus flavipes TaxID=38775 RepID=UPI002235E5B5|nr:interferon gamma receptor 1 isoform X2 [Antechinus flavipes]